MDYIPDPIELMDRRMNDLIYEFEALQKGVPEGSFRCPDCKEIRVGEPISVNSMPDSPVCCYECLPPELKKAYDEFERSLEEKDG